MSGPNTITIRVYMRLIVHVPIPVFICVKTINEITMSCLLQRFKLKYHYLKEILINILSECHLERDCACDILKHHRHFQ